MALLLTAIATTATDPTDTPSHPSTNPLLRKHSRVFNPRTTPMCIDPIVIPYNTSKPFPTKPPHVSYQSSPDDITLMDTDHDSNLRNQYIESPAQPSPFLSPKFVSRSARHKPRVVYNYKPVNHHLTTLQQPMPNFQTILPTLSNARYYTKIDLKSGYNQIPIHPDSRFLTTYQHRGRLWQWCRLPMGLSNAPALFQHAMTSIFSDHLEYTHVYLDDLLIYSPDLDTHLKHLDAVLTTCQRYNVYLNYDKCSFATTSTSFLGHTISHHFVSNPPSYIEPLIHQPIPANVSALRSAIGTINFVASHLPNIQQHLLPFHNLISATHAKDKRRKAPIAWSPELTSKYRALQSYVTDNYTPTLIPDVTRPFTLFTDASRTGCGATLLQHHPTTHKLTPVSFYSHLWHPPKAYAVRDLELHAVHLALRHWRHLLATGNPITLYTDH